MNEKGYEKNEQKKSLKLFWTSRCIHCFSAVQPCSLYEPNLQPPLNPPNSIVVFYAVFLFSSLLDRPALLVGNAFETIALAGPGNFGTTPGHGRVPHSLLTVNDTL
ncbi:hypothetical protein BO78DRAFT_133477 [Aspergillus sclerotiicarbonarius CBS 121057]|uniref:Uncharacterized protein n=1 Tax=Aspergillus sclerotiicarbonarius (strain CBS 121057 / IBT 28362) TaxID=1448318 RepID=A0A319EP18_ASPSB|nr:hypothetical protein BO78DRAFT_133477 [Aspergillus sclerotiicarbonarius CBS 121057]